MIVVILQWILFSVLYGVLIYSCMYNSKVEKNIKYSKVPVTPFNSPNLLKKDHDNIIHHDQMEDFDIL